MKFVNYQDGQAIDPITGEVYNLNERQLAFVQKMEERNMTPDGKEIPDPRPAKPHVRLDRRPSMFDYMRQAVRAEIERRENAEYDENAEEMADMDVDDELVEHLSEAETTDLELTLHKAERELEEQEAREQARLAVRKKSSAPKAPAPPDRPQDSAELGDSLGSQPGSTANE